MITLARFVATDPLAADPGTLAVLRDGVIDTLGCIHAGMATEVAEKSRKAVIAMGSEGSTAVIGTAMRVARPQAAFLNAVAGHALDFDDWEIPGNTHPTVVILPALLAAAAPGTSGADLAKAYIAGFEVIARLGEALNFEHYDAGWHSTATLGAPGAAAACARLLELNTEQTAHAMSLAISTASGYTCQFGTHAKPLQAGFAARAGVEAVLLARAGLMGQAHILDHPRGLAALMGGLEPARLEAAMERLARPYALKQYGLVLKPWPSCGYTHRIMTGALRLNDGLDPDAIARIDLHLPDFHAAVLPFRVPETRPEALFSLPFVAAMGLLQGGLSLSDLEEQAWTRDAVQKLLARTHVHPFVPKEPELNYSPADPDRVVVTLRNGATLEESCVYPLGAPQASMSEDQLWSKFRANLGLSSCDRGPAKPWIDALGIWPEQPSVTELFSYRGTVP